MYSVLRTEGDREGGGARQKLATSPLPSVTASVTFVQTALPVFLSCSNELSHSNKVGRTLKVRVPSNMITVYLRQKIYI